MPVKYSDEFKRDAVALVLTQGMSQKQVCADMGISKSALQAWVRSAELAGRGIVPAAAGDVEAQRGVDGGHAEVADRGRAGAEQGGGEIGHDLVDQARGEERRAEPGAALEEDVSSSRGEQFGQGSLRHIDNVCESV